MCMIYIIYIIYKVGNKVEEGGAWYQINLNNSKKINENHNNNINEKINHINNIKMLKSSIKYPKKMKRPIPKGFLMLDIE
jgi:hypothetical protein